MKTAPPIVVNSFNSLEFNLNLKSWVAELLWNRVLLNTAFEFAIYTAPPRIALL